MGMEAGGGRVGELSRERMEPADERFLGWPPQVEGWCGGGWRRGGRDGQIWVSGLAATQNYNAHLCRSLSTGERPFWDSTYQVMLPAQRVPALRSGQQLHPVLWSLILVDGFLKKIIYFYFVLHWVFVAFRELSLVGSEWGLFFVATLRERVSHCRDFFCFRARDLGARASVVAAHRLSGCSLRL